MKKQRFTKTDRAWIDGFFAGFTSGREYELSSIIRLLVRKRRQVRRNK